MILILMQKVANRGLISSEDLFFFLKITVISVQKVANRKLISGEDLFLFLEITVISVQKVANRRLISSEDLFLRDHYNFDAKSGVFSLYGPPIFFVRQNGPRLKKVGPVLNKREPVLKILNPNTARNYYISLNSKLFWYKKSKSGINSSLIFEYFFY